jgi:hypothetical protein
MYLLATDETNTQASKNVKFFIYGGLFIPFDKFLEIDLEIGKIRTAAGYKSHDLFKFDTNLRPNYVSIENFTEAKRKTVDLCLKTGCQFSALAILHKIINRQNPDTMYLWAADHVLDAFNRYLIEKKDYGFCLVDTLPVDSQWHYLREKFVTGLHKKGDTIVPLERIRLYGSTCANSSHINSAIDIVLGTFRYCVNNPKNLEIAKVMMANVIRMMWHTRNGENIYLANKGLILRPHEIKVEAYKKEYADLVAHINVLIKDMK